MQWSVQNRRPRQVWFCSSYQMQPLWIEVSRTVIRSPECFSANCFQMQVLEKIPTVSLRENSHLIIRNWSRILSLQEVFLVPFLHLSNRIVHFNSKLLRGYWADLQNEWFGIRALCLKHPHWSVWCLCHTSFAEFHDSKALALVKTGWPVFPESMYHLWSCWIPLSFRKVLCFSIPLLFISRTEERPVSLREFLRVFPDFFLNSKNKFHRFLFLSNQYRWTLTWRGSGLKIPQVLCSAFANYPESLEESAMMQILGKYSTRIQLVLHRFLSILCKKRTSWILPLDLPIFQLHLSYHSFSPDTVRNRSRQVLLPLSTGSLDHETILISSRMERCCESYSHSESLQNARISIFFEVRVLVDFQIRQIIIVQDEWLLS